MLNLSVPWWELVLRAAIVYGALLLLLRLTGKRQVGQLAPTDLVLLLVLSNAVQNSMNAGDNSLIGGIVSAVTLVALNYIVNMATLRNKTLEQIVDGSPQILVRHGQLARQTLMKAGITEQELHSVLRQNGCTQVTEVGLAILETNGSISVLRHAGATQTAARKRSGRRRAAGAETPRSPRPHTPGHLTARRACNNCACRSPGASAFGVRQRLRFGLRLHLRLRRQGWLLAGHLAGRWRAFRGEVFLLLLQGLWLGGRYHAL